jgi:hypothetical protein
MVELSGMCTGGSETNNREKTGTKRSNEKENEQKRI